MGNLGCCSIDFAFDRSGRNHFVALFAAVNESTWEHLKLAFWPAIIFATIAYLIYFRKELNFCLAQAIKLFSMPAIIIILFYGWRYFFPDNFIYDISIFVLAVAVGHIFAYKIEAAKRDQGLKLPSAILIVLLLISFSLFTYFPLKSFLFQDPVNGGYGIRS